MLTLKRATMSYDIETFDEQRPLRWKKPVVKTPKRSQGLANTAATLAQSMGSSINNPTQIDPTPWTDPPLLIDLTRSDEAITTGASPLRSRDATPNNLPVRLSTFIGREDELRTIGDLLRTHRLVTVIGSGGAGKTRLAIQAAAEQVNAFPDGAWWVELAPLSNSERVTAAVAQSVDAYLGGSTDHAGVIAARLGNNTALLVLDNCEHVKEAAARLAETLLQQCPNLRVLSTSRVPLDIPGETTWRVPPLALPERGKPVPIENLGQYDAVRLFLDRARNVRSTFALSDANGPTIADICHRLDGIPLAIELAAARTKSLLPSRILDGLKDSLRLLSGGSPLVLPRHQTLDASIRWSCALLNDREQLLLYRLSVFTGSFDLTGAEAVCADELIGESEVSDVLEQLIDHSLVTPLELDQEGRFMMLETVRQFGERQLNETQTRRMWQSNHALYYARIADEVSPLCETREQFHAVRTLELEHDNLRAALEWFRSGNDGEALGKMVNSLGCFWSFGGDRLEGTLWATRALAFLPDKPSSLRARILVQRGEWRLTLGDNRGAWEDCTAAIAMAKELNDLKALGRGNSTLTTLYAFVDYKLWRRQWEKTVGLLRNAEDAWSLTNSMTWGAAPLLFSGRTKEGLAALDAARPIVLDHGQPMLIASQYAWEAFAANQSGNPAKAEEKALLALESNALGSFHRIAGVLTILHVSRGLRGVKREQVSSHHDGLAKARREGEMFAVDVYSILGALEVLRKDPAEARRRIDGWMTDVMNSSILTTAPGLLIGVQAAFILRDFDDAAERANDLIVRATAVDEVLYRYRAQVIVGSIHFHRAEMIQADHAVREAISAHVTHGNTFALCEALEMLGVIASVGGDGIDAARIFGATASMRTAMEIPLGLPFDDLVKEAHVQAQDRLGAKEFDAAFASGSALGVDEVVAFVERTRGHRNRPTIGWSSLTPTELQVVDLVREGLTNREIAQRLLMGTETVKTHVSHIFSKLDVTKRSHLAALATQRLTAR